MRSCEYVIAQSNGKTRTIRLCDVVFRTKEKEEIEHTNPDLLELEYYVSITFEEQKNETKRETRTQQKTGNKILCPYLRWGRAVIRTIRFVESPTPNSCVCEMNTENTKFITQEDTLDVLRMTCLLWKDEFNFSHKDIGNKSVQSGAAVKIMLLGRWKRDSWLAYICPQIMEWTTNMSCSMIDIDNFRDLGITTEIESRLTPSNRTQDSYCCIHLFIPRLYLNNW